MGQMKTLVTAFQATQSLSIPLKSGNNSNKGRGTWKGRGNGGWRGGSCSISCFMEDNTKECLSAYLLLIVRDSIYSKHVLIYTVVVHCSQLCT